MFVSEELKSKIKKFLNGFSLAKEPAFANSLSLQNAYSCKGSCFGCTGGCVGCSDACSGYCSGCSGTCQGGCEGCQGGSR